MCTFYEIKLHPPTVMEVCIATPYHTIPVAKRTALSDFDLCEAKAMSSGNFSFHTLLCMRAHASASNQGCRKVD